MFDLVSAHDFYTMLVQDFDDFVEESHSARKAVHCAITAHHLTDWVWHDKIECDAELKNRLGIETLKEFAAWVDARSIWMTFVHDIANGTKHVRKKQTFETMRVVSLRFSFDTPHAGFDEGTWDGRFAMCKGVSRLERMAKDICCLTSAKRQRSTVGFTRLI